MIRIYPKDPKEIVLRRMTLNMKQPELARAVSVSNQTISRIENGRAARMGTAYKIAAALGVSFKDLFEFRADPDNN